MMRIKQYSFTLMITFFAFLGAGCSESDQSGDQKMEAPAESDQSELSLDQVKANAEKARQQASESGFEWNTIQPLLDKANEAMEKGDEDLAHQLFAEAKAHADLAIEQASYADENWQLLIPEN